MTTFATHSLEVGDAYWQLIAGYQYEAATGGADLLRRDPAHRAAHGSADRDRPIDDRCRNQEGTVS